MTSQIKKYWKTVLLPLIAICFAGSLWANSPQDLSALKLRVKRLNNELTALQPTDPDYDKLFLAISDELRQAEAKLINAEQTGENPLSNQNVPNASAVSNSSPASGNPIMPKESVAGSPKIPASANGSALPDKAAVPNDPAVPIGSSVPNRMNNPAELVNGINPSGAGTPASVASANGSNAPNNASGSVPPALPPGNNFLGTLQNAPGNANILQHMKTELTSQLRQIQQILRTLQPEDQSLAATLKEQQAEISKELAEINRQLEQTGPGKPETDPVLQELIGTTNKQLGLNLLPGTEKPVVSPAELPAATPNGSSNSSAADKASAAGTLYPETKIPAGPEKTLSAENPVEAAPPVKAGQGPAWNEQNQANVNPYEVLTSEDVKQLKSELNSMKTELKTITEAISNIESQLKLLTRQATGESESKLKPADHDQNKK